MPKYCLTGNLANIFKQKLQSGEIDPGELSSMSSEERNTFFKDFLGEENARNVNSLFESKLLLKNTQKGMITWAKTVSGLKPTVRNDLISKIERMDQRILNPKDNEQFLKDLASTKLGTTVTKDEASQIAQHSKNIQDAKTALQENVNDKKLQENYGMQIQTMNKYLDKVLPSSKGLITNIASLPHSVVASLDFSAPFKHGFFSMTNPAWIKNYVKMAGMATSEKSFDKQMAKIYGNKYYNTLTRSGLHIFKMTSDLNQREEQFASKWIAKIPVFRGSERAYTGFLNGLRMDMASKLMKGLEMQGKDISEKSRNVESIVKAVNDLTAASTLPGGMERSANAWSNIFFSPRMNVARFNMLNPYTYLNPKYTSESRVFMLKNLIGSTVVAATALGLASIAGYKVGTDPNKTDFGEMHIGNSTIDTTGGNRTLVTLISRLLSGKYVSNAGKTTQLGVGSYKPLTRLDLAVSYGIEKLAPGAASSLADFLDQVNGKDPFGTPVTIPDEIKKQLTPLYISDGMEMFNNDPSNTALSMVLGLFGISVNSATSTGQTDWSSSTSKEIQSFHQKVGDTQFQKANQGYNNLLQQRTTQITQDTRYKALSDTDKQKTLTKLKANVLKSTFKQYDFKYHPKRTRKNPVINQLAQ